MKRVLPRLLAPGLLLGGCRPAEAPATLDELSAYLFAHVADEDDEALVAGTENLRVWMDANLEATLAGYTIDNLDQETVDALPDGLQRDLVDLVGAAVGNDSAMDAEENTFAVTWPEQEEIYPDTYVSYDREFTENTRECFLAHDCDWLVSLTESVASYPLNIEMSMGFWAQYRWVPTEQGNALVYRTWLDGPAEISTDLLTVDSQFYLGVILPAGDRSVRLMATWMVATIASASVPEGLALDMVIDSMVEQAATSDAWLQAQGYAAAE
jgi:hypothetical protein